MYNYKDPSVFGTPPLIGFRFTTKKPEGAFILPALRFLINKDLVFEATLVIEAATKKNDCGTKAKTKGLISFATFFFLLYITRPWLICP